MNMKGYHMIGGVLRTIYEAIELAGTGGGAMVNPIFPMNKAGTSQLKDLV